MSLHTLLNAVIGNETGSVVNPQNIAKIQTGIAQASYAGGTGNAIIEGRISPNQEWATLHTFTSDGIVVLDILPEMRARTTANSGSAITVGFWEW